MSTRELVVLGTAGQAPTRQRNTNGYLLRWDGTGFLFDPGEGTQRQLLPAGLSGHDIDRVTHFHAPGCPVAPGNHRARRRVRAPHRRAGRQGGRGVRVRCLVLTHFSARYPDSRRFHDEAAAIFGGRLVVAEELARVPMPPRR